MIQIIGNGEVKAAKFSNKAKKERFFHRVESSPRGRLFFVDKYFFIKNVLFEK